MMIRAAIIGLGDISPLHIHAILSMPDVVLAAGCDVDLTKRTKLPPETSFYTDYTKMLAQEELDIVHICLPHHLHYPVGAKVAEARKYVFCEKPLALTSKDAISFAQLEKTTGVKIGICLQNRYNPTTRELLRQLAEGDWGKVTGLRGTLFWKRDQAYYAKSPWRGKMELAGGGCMINQAIHTLDLLQLFAGSPVSRIRGWTGQLMDLDVDVEDTANARIDFENGVECLFMASVANYQDNQVEIEVQCEKVAFLIREQTLYLRDPQKGLVALASDRKDVQGKQVYGNGHFLVIQEFYSAVRENTDRYLHANQGIDSIRLIEGIQRSGTAGESVGF